MKLLFLTFVLFTSLGAVQGATPFTPITGTFLDVAYDTRMTYTNNVSFGLSCSGWAEKMSSFKTFGVDTVIFQAVHDARWGSYYPSSLPFMSLWGGRCGDVVEAVLNATAILGMKVFLSCEYVHTEFDSVTNDTIMKGRLQIMKELVDKYVHRYQSTSFRGWYFSSEAFIAPYFDTKFLNYIGILSAQARSLTPKAQIFISPFGTRHAVNDSTFVNQLAHLPVDIVAYQDEVGCVRDEFPVVRSAEAFARLAAAHDAANRSLLWANVESFTWEGHPNNVTSPLIPAEFSRLQSQLMWVHQAKVHKVITFTAQGMYESPTAHHPWGGANATLNYNLYQDFRSGRNAKLQAMAQAMLGSLTHEGIGASVSSTPLPSPTFSRANLTDGLFGPQQPFDGRWAAFLGDIPVLWLVKHPGANGTWLLRNVGVHFLRVPPVWFTDGNWNFPQNRNITSDIPARVEFYTGDAAVLQHCFTKPTPSLARGCLETSASFIGVATRQPLYQTSYDIRSELLSVTLDTPIQVHSVVAIAIPQFEATEPAIITDEFIVNYR